MKKQKQLIFSVCFIPLLFTLEGCAYVEAKKMALTATAEDFDGGFPYFMKKPLLIVSNATVNVIWVDDHTNFWAVKIGAVLAKNKSKVEFGNNGSLSKIDADLEDDAIAIKFLDFASNALGEAMKAGLLSGSVNGMGQTGKFQIFDFEYDQFGNILRLKPLITADVYKQMVDITPPKTIGGDDSGNGTVSNNQRHPNPDPPTK